jgi:hypothetical protein
VTAEGVVVAPVGWVRVRVRVGRGVVRTRVRARMEVRKGTNERNERVKRGGVSLLGIRYKWYFDETPDRDKESQRLRCTCNAVQCN